MGLQQNYIVTFIYRKNGIGEKQSVLNYHILI